MDLFYIDYDTQKKCYFVAPMIQPKQDKWLIEFKTRVKADEFLKKLLFGQINTPDKDPRSYKVKNVEENGQVTIYIPRT